MKNKKNFSIIKDLLFPIMMIFAMIPFWVLLGAFKSVGETTDSMIFWHAQDYVKKRW